MKNIFWFFSKLNKSTKGGTKIQNSVSGFSLLETIAAIVIVAISLSTTISLTSAAIHQITNNQRRTIALTLAQEGLELVRNNRDTAWKQNLPWDCAFPDKKASYSIEFTQNTIVKNDCATDFGMTILKNPTSFQLLKNEQGFNHQEGTATPFERKIFISDVQNESAGHEDTPVEKIVVTCEVSWKTKGTTEKISLSEKLTNWHKK